MDDEQLRAIASESEEVRNERASLKQKLSVLESGRQVLFEHIGMIFSLHPDPIEALQDIQLMLK